MSPFQPLRRHKRAGPAVLALCLAVGLVPCAFAQGSAVQGFAPDGYGLPDTAPFVDAQVVPDQTLAHMRGRFVDGMSIVMFGVNMISKWTTPLGQELTAGVKMGVDLSRSQPQVGFTSNLNIDNSHYQAGSGTSGQQSVQAGGIGNVSGVAQGIQVAGNSNSIGNNTKISVTTGHINVPTTGGPHQSSQTDPTTGATLKTNMGSNSVGVTMSVPQLGRVIQQIQGGQGLLQLVQTTGNLQRIENTMQLEVQLKSMPASMTHSNFNQALDMLRGLPH